MKFDEKNSHVEYYGEQKRIRECKMLLYIGLFFIICGVPLLLIYLAWKSNRSGVVAGLAFLIIGVLFAGSGGLGLIIEKKKAGKKIVITRIGTISFILAVGSIFMSTASYFGTVIALLAILLAIKAIKEGDNEYGFAGLIIGILGIFINLFVISLLT